MTLVLLQTVLAALALAASGCGREKNASSALPKDASSTAFTLPAVSGGGTAATGPYKVSARGGTPRTGPGERYNRCERIWCLAHGENFFIDHFLEGHVGWIIHDDLAGDIFVPAGRTEGPEFPAARRQAIRLCGRHVHPCVLGSGGGPVRDGYYTPSLGYDRSHYHTYGTRFDPCCINGQGFDFLHSQGRRKFGTGDLSEYRMDPDLGWQKPFRNAPTAGN